MPVFLTAPALTIRLAPHIARLFTQLFGIPLRRSALRQATQGNFRNNFPASIASVAMGRGRTRHNWQRTKVPVYGTATQTIPAVNVIVPAGLTFPWLNPLEIPNATPQISLRPTRNVGIYQRNNIPTPEMELILRNPPGRTGGRTPGPPPEPHRRRNDQKATYGFNRIQQFRHRLYDTPSELLELWHAITQNSGLYAIATALAANEAVDYAYGGRARALRDHVYHSRYWKLPVGIDTLNSLVHGRTTF